MLHKSPGFTAIALITLAVSIGANTAIFSIADGMLFRNLPYKEPDRLYVIKGKGKETYGRMLGADYDYLKSHKSLKTIEDPITQIAGPSFAAIINDHAEKVRADFVSENFLQVLGVQPILGRAFLSGEHTPGNDMVIVLTYGFWRKAFGGDPKIVGKSIILVKDYDTYERAAYQVVGVLPADFVYPDAVNSPPEMLAPQIWTPSNTVNLHRFEIPIVRLKPGVTVAQAQAELDSLMLGLREHFPGAPKDRGAYLQGLQSALFSWPRDTLLMLLGSAALVLMIACTNLANFSLARGGARQRELGIRTALGAARQRLVRQLLAESLLVSILGVPLALFLADGTFKWVMTLIPFQWHHFEIIRLGLDGRVFLFTVTITALTCLTFGLVPAIRLSRPDLNFFLKQGPRSGARSASLNRHLAPLVVVEVALAFVLLAGAGLLLNSYVRARTVNLGFDPGDTFAVSPETLLQRAPEGPQRALLFQQIMDRVRSLPGVLSVAGASKVPSLGAERYMKIAGNNIAIGLITAEYFETLHVSVVKGRAFANEESFRDAPVAIISENAARLLWPGEEALGRILQIPDESPRQVVGVCADTRDSFLRDTTPAVYLPFQSKNFKGQYAALLVRIRGDAEAFTVAVASELSKMDRERMIVIFSLNHSLLSRTDMAIPRFQTYIFSLFAFFALILAIVGICGVVSYSVSRRTHEIGLRKALGATESDVTRMIVRQAMIPVLLGAAIGLAGALALTRLLESSLNKIKPNDPATFVAISILLLGTAALSSYLPAHRAAKIDPIEVLRAE